MLMAYPLNILPCRYTLDIMCCQQFGAARSSVVRHVDSRPFTLYRLFVPLLSGEHGAPPPLAVRLPPQRCALRSESTRG